MNFKEICDELKIDCADANQSHHVTTGWIGIDCPYCSPNERKYKLGYNITFGYLSCWSCGGMNLCKVLMEISGCTWRQISCLTNKLEKIYLEERKISGKLELPEGLGDLEKCHRRYLEKRGFDPDEISEKWGIKGIALCSDLKWRIWIPILYRSQIVSWTTRSISDIGCRYVSAKSSQERMCHKDILYGEDHVRNSVIVCEGPTDVWRVGPGAVCTFGLSYSASQMARMARYARRAICFDAEPIAQRKARRLIRDLSVFPGETYNVQLSSKDPGSCNASEILELREKFL